MNPFPMRVRSHCKVNLGLAIGPRRSDGFHSLLTVYQTLQLHDFVTVSAVRNDATRITLSSNDERVPLDDRNTCWKMVAAALAAMNVHAAVQIEIRKTLPVQGGLGAGSANAVAALLGLEAELKLRLTPAQRFQIAEQVGSDVPLFLVGGAVLGVDRGQEVYPLPDSPPLPCVIALPGLAVSTPQAFRDWDTLNPQSCEKPGANAAQPTRKDQPALTETIASSKLKELSRAVSACFSGVSSSGGDLAGNPLLALVRTGIENDFEQVVFSQHPPLRAIKRALEGSPKDSEQDRALYAALSGSGSALFGLYSTMEAAERAKQRVEAEGVRAIRTTTLPREKYWSEIAVCS